MKQKNRSCKRIISFDITTGEVFKDNSLNECAAKHGVPRQAIYRAIKSGKPLKNLCFDYDF